MFPQSLILLHRPTEVWRHDDLPSRAADSRNPRLRPANLGAGNVHAEADAEDGGLGLLRCEGGTGVARQVGRYGGDSDADYEQSEAAPRGGSGAGGSASVVSRRAPLQ